HRRSLPADESCRRAEGADERLGVSCGRLREVLPDDVGRGPPPSSRSPHAILGPGGPAPVSAFACWWTTSESDSPRSKDATCTWSVARPAALASRSSQTSFSRVAGPGCTYWKW